VSLLYLLDTNVASESARPSPRERVVQRVNRYEGQIAIASVVWHELRYGLELLPRSHRRDRLERYLNDEVLAKMSILDYDPAAAEWHARERVRLTVRGQTPTFADGQIAAIAAVHNLTLVTFNVDDFNRFEGLRVESWS
jgi:tRNA(fMet)-specific endonuclease VapC